VARDDGTLRERFLAVIEGEIIAARIRLARLSERLGDEADDDRLRLVRDTLAALEADRDRIRAGDTFDEQEARTLLAQRRAGSSQTG
jgi:hypothetical protein